MRQDGRKPPRRTADRRPRVWRSARLAAGACLRASRRRNGLERSTSKLLLHLPPIQAKLEEAQSGFLRAADESPAEQWAEKTRAEQWSAAEITAHLIMVERAVVSAAAHIVQKQPRFFPLWKRLHLPIWLGEIRIVRLEAPFPVDPQLVGKKAEMLGELRLTRERTLAFLVETETRDLRAYRWKHPFLGPLNTYEWFEMIAAHQVRHTKQLKDLIEQLPKVVESSKIQ